MNILVTGGVGYIGSHTSVALLNAGHNVIIVDDLSNSKIDTIEKIKNITGKSVIFYEEDVANEEVMNSIFESHKIDAVIHFAGYKAVAESVEKPLMYYYNNLLSTMVLCRVCNKYNVNKFIFSSSATVYGNNKSPMLETMDLLPTTNPYGETKAMIERILIDIAKVNKNFSVAILRYFNPVGAHESGLIGELPNGTPNNLMPYIAKVACGELSSLKVFGNDYPTVDGTGVRDYIHVMDLAEGHIAALNNIKEGINIYNLGTGVGTSVLELLKAYERASGIDISYEIAERRSGDIASCYADVTKAKEMLNWSAKRNIDDMCVDSWRFQKTLDNN